MIHYSVERAMVSLLFAHNYKFHAVPTCSNASNPLQLQSVIAKQRLIDMGEKDYIPAFMNFSAQTNSSRTQEIIENKLEKKRKNILGRVTFTKYYYSVEDQLYGIPNIST